MKFSMIATAGLVAFATAHPTAKSSVAKRAVFTTKTYNELSISGGVAGTAKEDALAVLSGLPSDLTTVDKADLDFLNSVNQIANDAETEAYNVAIDAAADDAEKAALQCGKIQNKVLKLTATMLKLEAQAAQGQDVAAKIATETKKLNNNISQDQASAGDACTKLDFDATTK